MTNVDVARLTVELMVYALACLKVAGHEISFEMRDGERVNLVDGEPLDYQAIETAKQDIRHQLNRITFPIQ